MFPHFPSTVPVPLLFSISLCLLPTSHDPLHHGIEVRAGLGRSTWASEWGNAGITESEGGELRGRRVQMAHRWKKKEWKKTWGIGRRWDKECGGSAGRQRGWMKIWRCCRLKGLKNSNVPWCCVGCSDAKSGTPFMYLFFSQTFLGRWQMNLQCGKTDIENNGNYTCGEMTGSNIKVTHSTGSLSVAS